MDKKTVEAENERLMLLFEDIDQNKIDFVREHVRQLAWYNCEIKELQQSIDENGITVPFQNGRNQSGLQSNPDLKALCDLQKLASAMVKILLPLVPEKPRHSKIDDWRKMFDCDDEEDDQPPVDWSIEAGKLLEECGTQPAR